MPSHAPANEAVFAAALAALRRGEAIGLPTETVYGLAADASNADAVRNIFALKGRPADHPLIVHIADASQLAQWASAIPETATRLADAFWPGPLTMILKKREDVPAVVTGGQDSIGLRCPAHPVALAVLNAFGGGLAAPSANRFGHVSPTTAQHVRDEFGAAVPIVLDGGDCAVGIESTIVDLSGAQPRLLRPGRISCAELEAVIGHIEAGANSESPRASGLLEKHYAPRTATQLLSRAQAIAAAREQDALGKRVVLLALATLPDDCTGIALPADSAGYAHGLYAALRELDGQHAHLIVVERPPDDMAWIAVNDRLRRSAAGAGEEDAT
jgi:L-threonylcarbamoyladenylate synthase